MSDVKAIKDSGERRTFVTGAVREQGPGKGRPDLRPIHALNLLDRQMEAGEAKYRDRNWEQGIPLSAYFNSAQRHADKLLAGYDDEDHLGAWLWNVACYAETKYRIDHGLLPQELDDMPDTFAGRTPRF